MYEKTITVNGDVQGYFYDHDMVRWYIIRYSYKGMPILDLDKDIYKSQNREVVIDALHFLTPYQNIARNIDFMKKENPLLPGGVHTYETT